MLKIDKLREETIKNAWSKNKTRCKDELVEINRRYDAGLIGFAWCAALGHMQQEGFLSDEEAGYMRDLSASIVVMLAPPTKN